MPGYTQPGDPYGRYFWGVETEQDSWDPFDQVTRVSGQASEMPRWVWTRPLVHWSLAIPANLARPFQLDEGFATRAPWVPRSGDGVGMIQIAAAHHANSDIPYVKLKAPKGMYNE